MAEAAGRIAFMTEDGEEVDFFVLEQARIGGINYILVADSEGEEAEALILKEITSEGSVQGTSQEEEVIYDIVEEEQELNAISKVFVEMMDDVDIEVEKE